jgi:8-oxo-dGTP diphosphatase
MSKKLRVVACLARQGSLIFMAKRLSGGPDANRWELPGGKVDLGETDATALKRELFEELGVNAKIGRFVGEASHGDIHLAVYEASWESEARGMQGQQTGWYSLNQIRGMDVPASDIIVIEGLSSLTEVSL